ncbi:hypothetical protein ABZX30_11055 [Streptomyces sp. NPDC004542]|uniref:hypothetical protein n=1 Tax=Streptomyces sp. NPDC004542 TaxID=3154281 RepID=UPI00339FBC4B
MLPAAQQAAAAHDHLAASYAGVSAAAEDPAKLRDAKFAYGLGVVLDGLALRLPDPLPPPGPFVRIRPGSRGLIRTKDPGPQPFTRGARPFGCSCTEPLARP